jgi:type II secretory ATPase GspE/PulE/Tfp pilus assembly ATPase PilB-like protein
VTTAARLLRAGTDAGLIPAGVEAALLDEARRARKDPLDLATTRLRLPREAFYRALARQRGLPFVEAGDLSPDAELLARAPARLLQRKDVLPLRLAGASALVANADPDDAPTLEALGRALERPLALAVADPAALQVAVRKHVGASVEVSAWDGVAFLDDLMRQAWLRRASDLHLDAQEEGLVVRLRVDGRLTRWGAPLSADDGTQLLSRVKVLGGLDIAEKREPQDGGFTWKHEAQTIDVRVATIPCRFGERATLRLLGVETRGLTIDNLGFGERDLGRLREALANPHGMVLLTGPTGSGKTTTLYAALRAVASPDINVLTVEDPIEFVIPGITQIQVDRAGKVTFARALRALLRHDPDVLMVGEIRDQETADVALKAATTGHLVLSSLHTNRAASAVGRLVDLGCERYLVASTLRGSIAQRLVRGLCARCRVERHATAGDLRRLVPDPPAEGATVFEPGGCPACLGTGYAGRIALSECLWVDDDLARAITDGASEEALVSLARAKGARTLAEDGLAKALAGRTSVAEALMARA